MKNEKRDKIEFKYMLASRDQLGSARKLFSLYVWHIIIYVHCIDRDTCFKNSIIYCFVKWPIKQ